MGRLTLTFENPETHQTAKFTLTSWEAVQAGLRLIWAGVVTGIAGKHLP